MTSDLKIVLQPKLTDKKFKLTHTLKAATQVLLEKQKISYTTQGRVLHNHAEEDHPTMKSYLCDPQGLDHAPCRAMGPVRG